MEGIKYLWPISEAAEHTKQSQSNVQVFGTLSIDYLSFSKHFIVYQLPIGLGLVSWNHEGFIGEEQFPAVYNFVCLNVYIHPALGFNNIII